MLRCATATADGLCGFVAGGLPLSVHVKINYTVWEASKLSQKNSTLEQYKQLHMYCSLIPSSGEEPGYEATHTAG